MSQATFSTALSGPWHGAHAGTDLLVDADGFGVIDETAQRVFTQGQCHTLALALHEQTGWPLVVDARHGDFYDWGHVCVQHPDAGLVDISGLSAPSLKVGSFHWAQTIIEPEDVPDLPHAFDIPDHALATAHCFARTVLRDLED